MRARDLIGFALGSLRGHGLRTSLTVVGVAIGVAAVVMLTSLGEGARRYVVGEFASLGSNLVIVLPGKTETVGQAPMVSAGTSDLTLEDAREVERRIMAIRRVAPVCVGTARAVHGSRGRETTVIGTTRPMLEVRSLRLQSGRYLPEGVTDAPICVLGAVLARELFAGDNPLGELIRVGGTRLRVIGVMEPRGTSVGLDLDEVIHLPVDTAMRMFDQSSLFRLLCEVRSPDEIEQAQQQILALLEERHGTQDVTAITQDAVLSTFDRVLGALTVALGLIAAISLAVAGIGIMNVMLVDVSERTHEIGLLKALGVTERQLLSAFLLEAAIISAIGGVFGLLFGMGAGQIVQIAVPALPVRPPLWAVVAAIAVSSSVGMLFGFLPARRAMRLDPVDALTRQVR
jgi:putative ABC transport system permease protein